MRPQAGGGRAAALHIFIYIYEVEATIRAGRVTRALACMLDAWHGGVDGKALRNKWQAEIKALRAKKINEKGDDGFPKELLKKVQAVLLCKD